MSFYSGVYLCGSSAGGHLAAMMLAQDWLAECMVNHSFIKGELHGLMKCTGFIGITFKTCNLVKMMINLCNLYFVEKYK